MSTPSSSGGLVEALNQEHIRINAVLPRLDPASRERAAQAHLTLSPLATSLAEAEGRYDRDHDPADLIAAVAVFDELRASPRWPHLPADERSLHCGRAARCLRERYELAGDPAVLEASVAVARDAVAAGEEAAGLRGTDDDGLVNLRGMLPPDPDAAVLDGMAELVRLARSNAARVLPAALGVLAAQLTARFERDGGRSTIDQALALADRAVALLDDAGAPVGTALQLDRGHAQLVRFKRYGQLDDIDAVVRSLRAAAEDGAGHDLARILDGLGSALVTRAELPGYEDDLDEAVTVLERAVALEPDSPWFRTNLAVALSARYATGGRIEDARRAEALLQEARDAVPPSAPDRARIEQNLLAIRSRKAEGPPTPAGTPPSGYGRAPDAVRDARKLLAATPDGARARPARLGGLAASLIAVAATQADPRALTEAVDLLREALDIAPPDSPDRPSLLAGLGRGLRARYCLLGDPADLASALEQSEAAAGRAVGAERAEDLREVALTRSLLSARSGSAEDAQRTAAAFRDALDAAGGDVATTVATSRDWARWCAEQDDWDQSAAAAGIATTAVERLDRAQTGRADRELALARASGLAEQAAVALVQAGRPQDALVALERGRLRLLADALSASDAVFDRASQVAELARDLPLAYVAVDGTGAVVVTMDNDGAVGSRFLPDVTSADLRWIVAKFASAELARADDPDRWKVVLRSTMQWLGSTIWATIRDLLPTHCTGSADAEIGVIPCGLLGLLPLHAATRPEPRAPGGFRHALDDCAITVVPSAWLVRDRRRTLAAPRASRGGPAPSVLAVDVAERAGFARLEHVEAEADAVLGAVGRGRRLSGPKATRQALLAAIESHDILHLACHGIGDVLGARGARLLLAGGDEVSAEDLLDMEGLHARLAILSACQSAVYRASLADEMLGLPTALLQSGVVGVMGTLWEVNDVSTMLLVRRFFEEWTQVPERPAVALRRAQTWLRDADNAGAHAAFPDVAQLQPPSSPTLRAGWNQARRFAGPEHWASFAYLGW